jgi:hypothetical protein
VGDDQRPTQRGHLNYENVYWLCYMRGPAGIIVELGQKIG